MIAKKVILIIIIIYNKKTMMSFYIADLKSDPKICKIIRTMSFLIYWWIYYHRFLTSVQYCIAYHLFKTVIFSLKLGLFGHSWWIILKRCVLIYSFLAYKTHHVWWKLFKRSTSRSSVRCWEPKAINKKSPWVDPYV